MFAAIWNDWLGSMFVQFFAQIGAVPTHKAIVDRCRGFGSGKKLAEVTRMVAWPRYFDVPMVALHATGPKTTEPKSPMTVAVVRHCATEPSTQSGAVLLELSRPECGTVVGIHSRRM
jgi:hypothetical protein